MPHAEMAALCDGVVAAVSAPSEGSACVLLAQAARIRGTLGRSVRERLHASLAEIEIIADLACPECAARIREACARAKRFPL